MQSRICGIPRGLEGRGGGRNTTNQIPSQFILPDTGYSTYPEYTERGSSNYKTTILLVEREVRAVAPIQ